MADYCRITIVGNLSSDIQQTQSADDPRQVIGVTTVCVSRTQLTQGEPEHLMVPIPVEIVGAARSARAVLMCCARQAAAATGPVSPISTAVPFTLPRDGSMFQVCVGAWTAPRSVRQPVAEQPGPGQRAGVVARRVSP